MLVRRRITRLNTRNYSAKVRAFPFQLTPEDAIRQLAPLASVCLLLKKWPGSFINYYFPSWGFQPVKPNRIQPLYLPAWFVDAEIDLSMAEGLSPFHTVKTMFKNAYFPGFAYDPLSRLSFNSDRLHGLQPIPFTDALHKQHEISVTCLPYAFTPFAVLKHLRSSLSKSKSKITYDHLLECDLSPENRLKFDPTNITPQLIHAHPVLIPVYLASYSRVVNHQKVAVTMIIEAHTASNDARIVSDLNIPRPENTLLASWMDNITDELNTDLVTWNGEVDLPFIHSLETSDNDWDHVNLMQAVWERWAVQRGLPARLVEVQKEMMKGKDPESFMFDDWRVRGFTPENTAATRFYMDTGTAIFKQETELAELQAARLVYQQLTAMVESWGDAPTEFLPEYVVDRIVKRGRRKGGVDKVLTNLLISKISTFVSSEVEDTPQLRAAMRETKCWVDECVEEGPGFDDQIAELTQLINTMKEVRLDKKREMGWNKNTDIAED